MIIKMRSVLIFVAISTFVLGTCIQANTAQSFQSTASQSLESSRQKRDRLPRDTESTESPPKKDDCGYIISEVKPSDLRKNPSAGKSNMSDLIFGMLDKFGSYTRKKPSDEGDIETFRNVLKMELITISTKNHLVLPISDGQTESALCEKVKWIFNEWFDITQAEEVNDKLITHLQAITDGYLSSGANITVDMIKNILASYQMPSTFVHPLILISPTPPPNVFFPLEDLIEKKPITDARLAEWLLNFDVRRFFLHDRFLYHTKKPTHAPVMTAGYAKYWDERYNMFLRVILERAKTHKDMRCIYRRALNDFARYYFRVDDYPDKMMEDFQKTLLWNMYSAEPGLMNALVAQATKLQDEEMRYRFNAGRYSSLGAAFN